MTADPTRLRATGATELERRLLDAGAREQPTPELTRRMQQALGLSAALITAATSATASAVTVASAVTRTVFWARLASGVVAVAVAGGAIGVAISARTGATHPPAAVASAAPIPLSTPPRALPEPSAAVARARVPARTRHEHARTVALARKVESAPEEASDQDLRGEIALCDAARAALRAGAPARALAVLERHDASYRAGTLAPEATVLRIEALAALGRAVEARTLARRFLTEHPDSPLGDRVRGWAR